MVAFEKGRKPIAAVMSPTTKVQLDIEIKDMHDRNSWRMFNKMSIWGKLKCIFKSPVGTGNSMILGQTITRTKVDFGFDLAVIHSYHKDIDDETMLLVDTDEELIKYGSAEPLRHSRDLRGVPFSHASN